MFNSKDSVDEKSKGKGLITWVLTAVFSLLLLLGVKGCFPEATPFDTFEFWHDNLIIDGMLASWPIYLWGGVLTAIVAAVTLNKREINRNAEFLIIGGPIISAIAGIFEEMTFRWILFLWAIVTVKIGNFLFFGWLGFGLGEFIHMWIAGPIANFVTFGKMEWLLYDQGWAVGAAALAANAKFRDEHKYLGAFGWLNSWAIGMFMFYIMFTYGLMAAILSHFVYDLIIFTIAYIDACQERARGFV